MILIKGVPPYGGYPQKRRIGENKMKLSLALTATVYKVKEDSFHDEKTNKDIAFFKAIIDQNNDVASISVTKEVAEKMKQKLMQDYSLEAEYDTERKTFRIVGAEMWQSKDEIVIDCGKSKETK